VTDFSKLIEQISNLHREMQASASKAVNTTLTVRNYLIGLYLVEYEQHGSDRAKYGEALLVKISHSLVAKQIRGLTATELSRCRQFYLVYPQILGSLSQRLETFRLSPGILGTLSQELVQLVKKSNVPEIAGEKLIDGLSYSHFVQLIKIDDPLKRAYYEMVCIKNSLSVRELKRQIAALSFERTGLSRDKDLSVAAVARKVDPARPSDAIKDMYVFEFLDLPGIPVVEESHLEQALLINLQDFMLELGNGFCLEARQKRILIGDEYYFVDLVFYHRIMKCHVLVELKVEEFSHANIGQLRTYLNYYKSEMMHAGDNPPVGILLVTNKNDALVKYATADSDSELFVKQYLLELPGEKDLTDFVMRQLKEMV
jgi:predicted nuclease of restriction endonuclease-like (RecB) superfamily